MDNKLQAIREMWEFFEEKCQQMDLLSVEYDNGEKDRKSEYKKKKVELIEDTVDELIKMKNELK